MSREIKFRVWDQTYKIMVYPSEYGSYEFQVDGFVVRNKPNFARVIMGQYMALIPMQFTGLLDKNKTEIYEWDVLSPMSENIGPMWVVFEEGCFVIYNKFGRWGQLFHLTRPDYAELYQPEVIGNIHQHPNLISNKT